MKVKEIKNSKEIAMEKERVNVWVMVKGEGIRVVYVSLNSFLKMDDDCSNLYMGRRRRTRRGSTTSIDLKKK